MMLATDCFVEVPQLPLSTATDILSAWLADASRALSEEQRKYCHGCVPAMSHYLYF